MAVVGLVKWGRGREGKCACRITQTGLSEEYAEVGRNSVAAVEARDSREMSSIVLDTLVEH